MYCFRSYSFDGLILPFKTKGFLLLTIVTLAATSSLRVIGGRDAHASEFPYIVRLEIEKRILIEDVQIIVYNPVCTCSVLTTVWTLTAEHCIDLSLTAGNVMAKKIRRRNANGTFIIRYGSSAGPATEKHDKISFVLYGEKHPMKRSSEYTNDDIGLLRTETIILPRYGKLSAVDYNTLYGHEVFLTGYGLTNITDLAVGYQIKYDDIIMNASPLQVVKGMLNKCVNHNTYPNACVVQACGRPTSICPGDSGGAVVHPSGIVCVNSQAPVYANCQMRDGMYRTAEIGIFSPVSPYIDWIYDRVSP